MTDRVDCYKAALDAVRPFEGDTLKELRDYYKIGLTWSSNALEGNTLTISETKVVLEDGLTIGGRPLRDFYPISFFHFRRPHIQVSTIVQTRPA